MSLTGLLTRLLKAYFWPGYPEFGPLIMNVIDIINKFYKPGSPANQIFIQHGQLVAQKAVNIAQQVPQLNPDIHFIREAAMLHDIGIFLTNAREIYCNGSYPYISHGYLGRDLLEDNGLLKHALVCERHVGVGITKNDIKTGNLPFPLRDMLPVSIEEQIICCADKFFSKKPGNDTIEKSIQEICLDLKKFGEKKVIKFLSWVKMFNIT